MNWNKLKKTALWLALIIFLLMNAIAFFHAYKFTHFADPSVTRTTDPKAMGLGDKLEALLLGVDNPRPLNTALPARPYRTIRLHQGQVESWLLQTVRPKGTVVLFHGYGGHKSAMLDKAEVLLELGYNTLLVDFTGSGGSAGNATTIGYREAEQVKACFDHLAEQGEENIYLFGSSMGGVAIMKAINVYRIRPSGLILECPFGTLYQTVCARFQMLNIPTFPMAGLLTFWGGVQHGFWGFGHNPEVYARNIDCPVLLLYGAKDEKVSRSEIELIFRNLRGRKTLRVFEEAGHENYLTRHAPAWTQSVQVFLAASDR